MLVQVRGTSLVPSRSPGAAPVPLPLNEYLSICVRLTPAARAALLAGLLDAYPGREASVFGALLLAGERDARPIRRFERLYGPDRSRESAGRSAEGPRRGGEGHGGPAGAGAVIATLNFRH
jgi:hypothetical protein